MIKVVSAASASISSVMILAETAGENTWLTGGAMVCLVTVVGVFLRFISDQRKLDDERFDGLRREFRSLTSAVKEQTHLMKEYRDVKCSCDSDDQVPRRKNRSADGYDSE
jgi:hypothetical protein